MFLCQLRHRPLLLPAVARAPAAAPAPVAPAQPIKPLLIEGEMIVTDGKSKKWNELTPEEKTDIRRSISEARAELARSGIDRNEIDREIREAMAEVRVRPPHRPCRGTG